MSGRYESDTVMNAIATGQHLPRPGRQARAMDIEGAADARRAIATQLFYPTSSLPDFNVNQKT